MLIMVSNFEMKVYSRGRYEKANPEKTLSQPPEELIAPRRRLISSASYYRRTNEDQDLVV
jgi:hypothetical protein